MNQASTEYHRQELSKLKKEIWIKEELLRCFSSLSSRNADKSDLGWLLSMVAGDIGTLLAVSFGKRARTFDDVVRRLERNIMLLKVDEKLLEQKFNQNA